MTELLLVQNLLSKVFHDFAGSISAVNNSAEFLDSEDSKTKEKALDLLQKSAMQLTARLEFLRKAYGVLHEKGEANLDNVRSVCEAFLHDSKVHLDFQRNYHHQPEVFISIDTGRLILCLTIIAADALIHGGTITIKVSKTQDDTVIVVSAAGSKIKFDNAKNTILYGNSPEAELSAYNAHYYYTSKIIQQMDHKITINSSESNVEYIVE